MCRSWGPPTAFAQRQSDKTLEQRLWLQLPPRAAPVAAGYLQLKNTSDESVTLVSVSSEQFGQVEMHETVLENEMMAMRELPELVIAAGETVIFKPGGLHLMLMMAKAPVDASGEYLATLQLKTASGTEFQIQLPLEKRQFGQQQDHHGH